MKNIDVISLRNGMPIGFVMEMTKKDLFVEAYKKKTGKDPVALKDKPKEFAEILNKNPELRTLFRDAVADNTLDEDGAGAMASLFDGIE